VDLGAGTEWLVADGPGERAGFQAQGQCLQVSAVRVHGLLKRLLAGGDDSRDSKALALAPESDDTEGSMGLAGRR
jgi:hypothetical protein